MSENNLNFILKDLFKSFGKTLTKNGYIELKLNSPQEVKIVLTAGSVVITGFDEINHLSLSGFNIVRFNLPDFVSIISLIDKKDSFELESISDNFFQLSGLPIFSLDVEEDDVFLDVINKIDLPNKDFKNLIKVLKLEKKKLKKSFLVESELLIISFLQKTVTIIGEIDYHITSFGEKPISDNNSKVSDLIISLNKNEEKMVESLFKNEKDNLIILETKNNFKILSSTKSVFLAKREFNFDLYNTIVE